MTMLPCFIDGNVCALHSPFVIILMLSSFPLYVFVYNYMEKTDLFIFLFLYMYFQFHHGWAQELNGWSRMEQRTLCLKKRYVFNALRSRQNGRRHFQTHFLVWKLLYMDSNFTEVCSKGYKQQYVLVMIMDWRRTGARQLSKPMVA